jgi:hypothetical protein
VFPNAIFILPACVYPYFNEQDGYEFLTIKHVDIYRDGVRPDLYSLIWVCRYCRFWCQVFDPLIMERHLCVDCMAIPMDIRTFSRQIVYERLCVHMQQLFVIEIRGGNNSIAIVLLTIY